MSKILLICSKIGPFPEGLEFMGTLGEGKAYIAYLCGIQPPELAYHFNSLNLLDRYKEVRSWPKGYPHKEARRRAMGLRLDGKVVVLLGHTVARAFDMGKVKPFTWQAHHSATMAWIPAPTEDSQWYLMNRNEAQAIKFMRTLIPDPT